MTIARAARLAGLWLGLAGGLAPAAGAQPADDDAIITVAPQARGGSILVSFSTPGAVTPAVEQAIASGLPTTFTYDVELRRPSTFWFDKLVDSARIAVTVRFEPLTRRYHVMLLQDGRVAEERTTYDVRVRGRTSPRHTWSLWPWSRPSAHGSAGFTFLP